MIFGQSFEHGPPKVYAWNDVTTPGVTADVILDNSVIMNLNTKTPFPSLRVSVTAGSGKHDQPLSQVLKPLSQVLKPLSGTQTPLPGTQTPLPGTQTPPSQVLKPPLTGTLTPLRYPNLPPRYSNPSPKYCNPPLSLIL